MKALKAFFILVLCLVSNWSLAGGDSLTVKFMSLTASSDNDYDLVYTELESSKTVIVYLSYDEKHYSNNATFLTKEKFDLAIEHLKKQIKNNSNGRFGKMGSGPCLIDKELNKYKSDALDLYVEGGKVSGEKVVYSFCKYR